MANCPKCGAIWLWDWCGDGYVKPSGEPYKTVEMDDGNLWEARLVQCDCGQINAVEIICDCGGGPVNHKEWKDIDWEADEHSYDTYGKDKK